MLPKVNLRRTYLIARRDFLGYIKTWGFWISFLMPFLFGFLGIFMSQLDINVEPVRYETILDDTGEYAQAIIDYDESSRNALIWRQVKEVMSKTSMSDEEIKKWEVIYQEKGLDGLLEEKVPGIDPDKFKAGSVKSVYVEPPTTDIEAMKSLLTSGETINVAGRQFELSSFLHIYDTADGLKADYWSVNINNERLKTVAERYFRLRAREQYLLSGGLSRAGLSDAERNSPRINAFDPSKSSSEGQSGQAVTTVDRIPFFVAAGASAILWLTIFSGAYMLLTSMLEEKLNKLLEMMLSTTRLSEIMLGKLLGVAALTIAAMAPYILIGVGGSIIVAFSASPEMAQGLMSAFTPKLLVFFPIFLILGYVFYGALFIAMGSLAESMQDAQTLTTPIMLLLTGCVLVIPLSINSPDSPLLTFAAWFPLSAPFAAIARLPQDPPWWELALSAFFLFMLSLAVIWLAGRIFQHGVLSGSGVKGVTDWFKRVIFRRKSAG